MLTGIALGAGIMLIYLALISFAGRKLHVVDDDATADVSAPLPRKRR